MASKTAARFAAEVGDREAIRDCLYRYCRGIDRLDIATLRSAYWPDATDDHGAFKGSADAFVKWAQNSLQGMEQTHHMLGNMLIDIETDVARVETYYQAFHRVPRAGGEPFDLIVGGRYLDRLERRDDEWRIAHRIAVRDWFREYPDSADWSKAASSNRGRRMPDDVSYAV